MTEGQERQFVDSLDEILRAVVRQDEESVYRLLAKSLKELLQAEAGAVFLVPPEAPGYLRLVSQHADGLGHEFSPLDLRIHSEAGGGVTGWSATLDKPVALTQRQIKQNPYFTGKPAEFLRSRQFYSLLACPMRNRKGKLLGLAKVQNKLDSHGMPDPEGSFGDSDVAVATLFARMVVSMIENRRVFRAVRGLLHRTYESDGLDGMLVHILDQAIELTGGTRGDVAWWSENHQHLVLRVSRGEPKVQRGASVPMKSLIRESLGHDEVLIENDVRNAAAYWELDENTRSEACIRLMLAGRCLGALNVESTQLGFFDQRDANVLSLLAEQATVAAHMVERTAGFEGVARRLQLPLAERREFMVAALNAVCAAAGIECGLVYMADQDHRTIRCIASTGCEDLSFAPETFEFETKEIALATKVFLDARPYYSRRPWEDSAVSQKGLESFQIKGPLLGVPLIFGGAAIGVLVVWSRVDPEACPYIVTRGLEGHVAMMAAFTALVRQEQQQEAFLSTLFHGLSTPVHSVCGAAESLRKHGGALERALLDGLYAASQDLARLVGRNMDYRACILGRAGTSGTDIVSCVRDFVDKRRREDYPLEYSGPSHPVEVAAPSRCIEIVLDNLLENAYRFSKVGDSVRIELAVVSGTVEVAVEDRGVGVPDGLEERIFRLGESYPPPGQARSTGLGLPTSRQVAQKYGGSLGYVRNSTQKGARFVLTLPLVRAAAAGQSDRMV